MKIYLICPTCGSDDVMKNGMTGRAKQSHKCRDCGRQFVENPETQPKGPDTWSKIKLLFLEDIKLILPRASKYFVYCYILFHNTWNLEGIGVSEIEDLLNHLLGL